MGRKNRAGVSEVSFTFIFTIFMIFEMGRNFCGFGRLFENFDLWVKNFSKIARLQKCQKTSFFNICCFFVAFCAKWGKLPLFANFASQEFLRAYIGVPHENWNFSFKMHLLQLKKLSRNFC